MNKALYVFDFDGVIADSLTLCLKACAHAAHLEGRTIVLERDSWESLDNVTFEEMARVQGFTGEAVARFAAHVFAYTRQATPPAVFTEPPERSSELSRTAADTSSKVRPKRRSCSSDTSIDTS